MRPGLSGRFGHFVLPALFAVAATTASGRSHACGGCFHEPEQPGQQTNSTVVVAHRMALSVSTTQTVLWDQVQYAGAPESFAWVLPVKAGAYLELSNDAWFETLDVATSTRVTSPEVICDYSGFDDGFGEDYSSGGCSLGCVKEEGSGGGDWYGGGGYGGGGGGGGGEPPPPVVVVHQATVGPYETVTLHANVPDALPSWLADHGFVIDANVQPIIDAYTAEGFDFIAMRLLPGQGVDRMKPVRVVMPGASPTLPLRMVAAGTGANVAITLYVISESRYRVKNFENGEIDSDAITWDFDVDDSNYADLRRKLLAQAGGRTWSTSYARKNTLLTQHQNPQSGILEAYVVDGIGYGTIAEAYVRQALSNGEGTSDACVPALLASGLYQGRVVAACDANGGGTGGAGTGGMGGGGAMTGGAASTGGGGSAPVAACGPNELDARKLACGSIDDVAVALVGLHPYSVWLTRLESNLPRAALAEDLTLSPAVTAEVSNWLLAGDYIGDPCGFGGTPVAPKRIPPRSGGPGKAMIARGRTPPLALALAVTAVAAALGRRLARRRVRHDR